MILLFSPENTSLTPQTAYTPPLDRRHQEPAGTSAGDHTPQSKPLQAKLCLPPPYSQATTAKLAVLLCLPPPRQEGGENRLRPLSEWLPQNLRWHPPGLFVCAFLCALGYVVDGELSMNPLYVARYSRVHHEYYQNISNI